MANHVDDVYKILCEQMDEVFDITISDYHYTYKIDLRDLDPPIADLSRCGDTTLPVSIDFKASAYLHGSVDVDGSIYPDSISDVYIEEFSMTYDGNDGEDILQCVDDETLDMCNSEDIKDWADFPRAAKIVEKAKKHLERNIYDRGTANDFGEIEKRYE